jgi:diguanylate cyclase
MRQESPSQAVSLLRKAVPLMMKLNIAPTPYNYGVWYTYVSNRNKKLNNLMDSTIQKLGGLPDFVSKELFEEFILDEDLQKTSDHTKQLDGMLDDIGSSSEEMIDGLAKLKASLEKSKKSLKNNNDLDNIKRNLRYLESNTLKVVKHTDVFQGNLQDIQQQIANLKEEINRSKESADIDPITGLLNAQGFERYLYSWINAAEDDLSIILIDIDKLSAINKRYGKKVGNAIIRFLGQFLHSKKLENTITSRLDGGTFAVLICEESLSFNVQFAEQIRLQIENQVIRTKKTQEPITSLTVSIGISTLVGQELGQHLLDRAKKYLNNAKEKGGNLVSTN